MFCQDASSEKKFEFQLADEDLNAWIEQMRWADIIFLRGILLVKVFCHYDKKLEDGLRALRAHGEDVPVHTILETNYVVIEQGQ